MRIVKLGGSLLDWPHCENALRSWARAEPPMVNVVILGGGRAADAVRQRAGLMKEDAAHWEAIRCIEENGRQFAAECGFATVQNVDVACEDKPRSSIAVLTEIESHVRMSALPMSWTVTSDSIAAWFAANYAATELVLLKSCDASGRSALELSTAGVVDEFFPSIAERIPFRVVNLRSSNCLRDSTT